MGRRDLFDTPREDSPWLWHDFAIAALLIGVIVASHFGWIA